MCLVTAPDFIATSPFYTSVTMTSCEAAIDQNQLHGVFLKGIGESDGVSPGLLDVVYFPRCVRRMLVAGPGRAQSSSTSSFS